MFEHFKLKGLNRNKIKAKLDEVRYIFANLIHAKSTVWLCLSFILNLTKISSNEVTAQRYFEKRLLSENLNKL